MPQPRQPNTGQSRLNAKQGRYRWDTSSQFVDIVDIVDIYTLTREAPPPGGVDIALVSRYPMLRADCEGDAAAARGRGRQCNATQSLAAD